MRSLFRRDSRPALALRTQARVSELRIASIPIAYSSILSTGSTLVSTFNFKIIAIHSLFIGVLFCNLIFSLFRSLCSLFAEYFPVQVLAGGIRVQHTGFGATISNWLGPNRKLLAGR